MSCFYAPHQERVHQRCGGPVRFSVKWAADFTFTLCHEHRKWWNQLASQLSPGYKLADRVMGREELPMPVARRIEE